jgi:parallel beta-helix repeat protein/YD repeat-containing protein
MSKTFVVFVALSVLCFLLVLAGSAQEQAAGPQSRTATLTVKSRYGSPDPPAGTHRYRINTVITASAGASDSDDDSNGSRYVCIGWRATGSPETLPPAGTEDSVTFTLTTNTVITWVWKAEYLSTTSASLGGAGVTLYSAPTAEFRGAPTKGNVPLTVLFIDESIGNITSWSWNFGSGATPPTANTQGPHSVTYSTVGLKTVSLTVTGSGGSDDEVKVDYIHVLPAGAPVADFFGTPRSGIAPLTVQFTDESTVDIDIFSWVFWEWDFNNDGSIDSREQNPCWTYSNAGRYTVKLTVTVLGPGGYSADSETKPDYIRACDNTYQHVIYVTTNGDDANDGWSWATAKRTIQAGINAASNDRAVLVAKGTYKAQTPPLPPGNVNLDFDGKEVHLKGVAAADYGYPDCDVGSIWCIDCEDIYGRRAFIFQNQETEFSWVDGFTIINGNAPLGGGIFCIDSSPTITNCIIGITESGNTATYNGGGICCVHASPTIINCTIKGNDAGEHGGGICCEVGSNLTITNCTVESNTAFDGAGIYCLNSCPMITSCRIGSNQTYPGDGGGIYCCCCNGPYPFTVLSMVDCTIDSNSGYYGGGIYCDRVGQRLLMTMDNCTIRGNIATEDGGGIWCHWSDLTMSDCAITRNSAGCSGGGIACSDSGLDVSNCVIMNNTAIVAGGGIECVNGASACIAGCLIASNSTTSTTPEEGDGGGIAVYSDSDATITNCTIADNTATNNGGGIYVSSSTPVANNTILWGNSAGREPYGHQICSWGSVTLNYCDYANGENDVVGSVNPNSCITSDPGFVNAASRNYRLPRESPCIDAGDNSYIEGFATDLSGNPRIADGNYDDDPVVDIGAYEISNVWDTDGDGLLDPEEEFYQTNPDSCDHDGDGLNDWEEIFVYGTSPLKADTDGDSYNDKWEVDHGKDPLDPSDGIDNVPPDVLSTSPPNDPDGSERADINVNIGIAFTEPIQYFEDSFSISAGGQNVPFQVRRPFKSGSPADVVLDPNGDLPYNTMVTVTIRNIRDFVGNYMVGTRGIAFWTVPEELNPLFPQHEAKYYVNPPSEMASDGGMRKPLVCESCNQRYGTIPYTGECYWWEEDAAIPNPGDNSVAVIRSHRNKRNAPGAFGYNWSCNLDQHFVPEDPENPNNYNLIWTSPCGRTFKFRSTDGVNYTPPPGFPESVWKTQEGEDWYLYRRQKDGTIWKYQEYVAGDETTWRLVSRSDRNSNITTLEYNLTEQQGGDDDPGTLDKVIDMCGRDLSFEWRSIDVGGGQSIRVISKVTDPFGNEWNYTYYESDTINGLRGDLYGVISPGSKETTYTYWTPLTHPEPSTGWEIKHNLCSVRDPEGQIFLINYYDDYDRVIQQEYGYGIILNFYTFKEVEEQGVIEAFFVTTQVDRNGNVREFKHYPSGAGGLACQPAGGSAPIGNPYILDRVKTTIFGEDFDDPPTTEVTTTQYYTEDSPGPPPDYPRFALMRIKYPKGNGIIYERDNKGNITQETRRINFDTPASTDIIKSWTYDQNFAVVLSYEDEHNPGEPGNITTCEYDHTVSNPEDYFWKPNGVGGWIPDFPQGPHGGNLVRVVHEGVTAPDPSCPKLYPGTSQPQTVVEEYYYNSIGQCTGSFSPLGRVTAWKYYSKDYTGGETSEPVLQLDEAAEFARGKLHKSWTDYGGLMLCTETIYQWESSPPCDLFITTKQPRDFIDNVPRNPSVFYAITKLNVYGLTTEAIDAEGNTTTYGYDPNNNLSCITAENNLPPPEDYTPELPEAELIVTTYEHDILNHVECTTRTAGPGHTIQTVTEYDRKENPVIVRQPLGNYTETVYDERDMVKAVVRRPLDIPNMREDIFYEYDANGNLIAVWDSDGYADWWPIVQKYFKGRTFYEGCIPTTYFYDGFDRRIKVVDEEDAITEVYYNPAGVVTETITGTGTVIRENGTYGKATSANISLEYSHRYNTYDQLRRLVKTDTEFFKIVDNSKVPLDSCTGSDEDVTDWLVTTVNIYNEDSQLEEVVYDRDGYDGMVCRTFYTYDTAGRRDTVADWLGNTTTYSYDNNGNVIMTEQYEVSAEETYHSYNFYDELNRLAASVDNMGNTRRSYYDSRGNLRYTTDANGAESGVILGLDEFGEHIGENAFPDPDLPVNAAGHCTDYGYDALSRKTYTKRYLQYPSSYALATTVWDDNSRLQKQIDANSNVTQYFYENKDRRWRIRYANATETVILWHSSDVVYQVIDPNLGTITYYYDSLGRVINKESRPGPYSTLGQWNEYGTTFNFFTYDALGRVIFAEDNDTQTERTYDSLGNLLSETQTIGNWRGCKEEEFENPVTKTVSSRCDGSGNRLELAYPHAPNSQPAHHTEYTVDELNRVADISFDGSPIASYDYVGSGYRYDTKHLNNWVDLSITYDAARRPIQWEHIKDSTVLRGYQYAYDREGNKWYEKKTHGDLSADVYNYDGIYRLTHVKYGVSEEDASEIENNSYPLPEGWQDWEDTRTVNYAMDGAGNRTKVTDNGWETAYEPNCVNQYEYVGDTHNFYDRNGNLIFDWSRVMSYDSDNRLAVVAVPLEVAPDSVYSYRYDAFGRRVEQDKTFTFSGQGALKAKTYYFYDGNKILEEYSAYSGDPLELKARYIYGISGEPLARYAGVAWTYYHTNSLGSIMCLTDSAGNLIESYEYDVYGAPTVVEPGGRGEGASGSGKGSLLGGGGPSRPDIEPTINYLFEGWDWNADTGLYNYSDVEYDPDTGRLVQSDQVPTSNPYSYTENESLLQEGGYEVQEGGSECCVGTTTFTLAFNATCSQFWSTGFVFILPGPSLGYKKYVRWCTGVVDVEKTVYRWPCSWWEKHFWGSAKPENARSEVCPKRVITCEWYDRVYSLSWRRPWRPVAKQGTKATYRGDQDCSCESTSITCEMAFGIDEVE